MDKEQFIKDLLAVKARFDSLSKVELPKTSLPPLDFSNIQMHCKMPLFAPFIGGWPT